MALNFEKMATASTTPAAQAPQAAAAAPAGGKYQVDGYLNVYLPSIDGRHKKLGSISVSLKDDAQKELTEWLLANPEQVVALLPLLKLDFQPARSEGRKFDMSQILGMANAS